MREECELWTNLARSSTRADVSKFAAFRPWSCTEIVLVEDQVVLTLQINDPQGVVGHDAERHGDRRVAGVPVETRTRRDGPRRQHHVVFGSISLTMQVMMMIVL